MDFRHIPTGDEGYSLLQWGDPDRPAKMQSVRMPTKVAETIVEVFWKHVSSPRQEQRIREERDKLLQVHLEVLEWCRQRGRTLCPTPGSTDSFGDGIRRSQQIVRGIIESASIGTNPVDPCATQMMTAADAPRKLPPWFRDRARTCHNEAAISCLLAIADFIEGETQ